VVDDIKSRSAVTELVRQAFALQYTTYSASNLKIYPAYVTDWKQVCLETLQGIACEFTTCYDNFTAFIADRYKDESPDDLEWQILTAFTLQWMYTVNTMCDLDKLPSTTDEADKNMMNAWIDEKLDQIHKRIDVSICVY